MLAVVEPTVLAVPVIPAVVLVKDGVEPNEKGDGFGSFEEAALGEFDEAVADVAVAKAKDGVEVVELAELGVWKENEGVEEAVAAEAVLPKDRFVAKLKEVDEEVCVETEEFVPVSNKGEEEKDGVVVAMVEVAGVEPKNVEAGVEPKRGVDEPKRAVAGVEAVVLVAVLVVIEEEDVFKENAEPKPKEGAEEPKRGSEAGVAEAVVAPKRGLGEGVAEAVVAPKSGVEAGVAEAAVAPKRGLEAAAPKGLEAGVVGAAPPKRGLEAGVVAAVKRDGVGEGEEMKEKAGAEEAPVEIPVEAAGLDWKENGEAEEEDWNEKGELEVVEVVEAVDGAEEKLKLKPVDAIVENNGAEEVVGDVRVFAQGGT